MSEGESAVTMMSVLFAVILGGVWAYGLLNVSSLYDHPWMRRLLASSLPAGTLLILAGLMLWASHDVREAPEYLFQYSAMGAAGLVLVQFILAPALSLSGRQDVAERENVAVLWALLGAQAGFALAYLGANFGEGPGWFCVVWASAWSCGTLFVMWWAALRFAGTADRLTIDRDAAAGARLGGWLVAMGIIAGRGAAGDWVGYGHTVRDFATVSGPWLALGLGGYFLVERALRPRPDQASGDTLLAGAVPAAMWVILALTSLGRAGTW